MERSGSSLLLLCQLCPNALGRAHASEASARSRRACVRTVPEFTTEMRFWKSTFYKSRCSELCQNCVKTLSVLTVGVSF